MKAFLPALAALALSACTTIPAARPAVADPAIVRLQRGYAAARAIAALFAPYLPPDHAARLALLGQAAERAIVAARAAADAATLARAAAATAAYRHAAGQ